MDALTAGKPSPRTLQERPTGGLMVLIFVIHPSMRGPFVDFGELVVRKNCITRLRDLSAQTFCRVYIYVNAMLHRREALCEEGLRCNVMAYLSRGIEDNRITHECYKQAGKNKMIRWSRRQFDISSKITAL